MLLFVNGNSLVSKYVKEYLDDSKCDYVCIDEPDDNKEQFVAGLLAVVGKYKIDQVFSVNYYPQISLACGVLALEYVSWIVEGWSRDSYDFSASNKWNTLFTADYTLYSRLCDRCNISYYPLGYTVAPSERDLSKTPLDMLIWSNITHDLTSIGDSLVELKDSSKGYIDAMIEQRKNDLWDWSLYELFADYIREDVEKCYPLDNNSLEEKAWRYNRTFFFDEMDKSYAFPYIHYLCTVWKNKKGIKVALEEKDNLTQIDNYSIPQITIVEGDFEDIKNCKAVIIFQKIRDGNVISVDTWNILAKGVTTFLPEWIHVDTKDSIIGFKSKRDLFYKLTDLFNDELELARRRENCFNYAINNGSLKERIKTLIESNCK